MIPLGYSNIARGYEKNLNGLNTVLKHYFYTTRVFF